MKEKEKSTSKELESFLKPDSAAEIHLTELIPW